uniref:Uncharacterized protein n=1 Tax=Haptolina ericina TaxID=156174 RepID=A0A7S3EWJ3_9EUKA|mmetsp:Transcript_25298/g.57626  ORF Transcript_25298/g.57626 Transcript_25298/m.57626 type:complete len:262 (+) Transcript_25298:60-845(+)
MPLGKHAAENEIFGKPETERNFQSSLRGGNSKPLRTARDHRDFPWTRMAPPQSATDWKAASKVYVNANFRNSLREGESHKRSTSAPPRRPTGGRRSMHMPSPMKYGEGTVWQTRTELLKTLGREPTSEEIRKQMAENGEDDDPSGIKSTADAAAKLHERMRAHASADTLDRRVYGIHTAEDWKASSKPQVEQRFASSLRSWDGAHDVGANQDAINGMRLYGGSDPDRWPNNYGPTSYGGWKRITKARADEILKASLRGGSP